MKKVQQIGWKFWSLLSRPSYDFLCFKKFTTTLLWVKNLDFMNLRMKKEDDDETKRFSKSAENFGVCWAYQVIIFYVSKMFNNPLMGLKAWFHEFKNEKRVWWWDKKVQQIDRKGYSLLSMSNYHFLCFEKFSTTLLWV